MKKIVFLSLLFFSMLTIAQENYKVIVMPKKFDFLKEENQYNLNTMCKLFFEKEGFIVYYESDNLPIEIAKNRCNALYLALIVNNNMFKTKTKIEIKDCQNNVVAFSNEPETREKNLSLAYNEVTRAALISMRGFLKIKNTNAKEADSIANFEDKKSEIKTVEIENSIINKSKEVLQSVITTKGYNLIDSTKNIKFELLKTTNPTIFIAQKENIQGIFTLNGQHSKFESYQNNVLVVEEIEVKY